MKQVFLTEHFSEILSRAFKTRKSEEWFPVVKFSVGGPMREQKQGRWTLFSMHRKDLTLHEKCRANAIDLFFDPEGARIFGGKLLDYRDGRIVAVGDTESAIR